MPSEIYIIRSHYLINLLHDRSFPYFYLFNVSHDLPKYLWLLLSVIVTFISITEKIGNLSVLYSYKKFNSKNLSKKSLNYNAEFQRKNVLF